MTKQKTDWKLYRDTWISTQPVLPGIWQRKEGGYFVRARVVNPATGAKEEIRKMLANADKATAFKWLSDEKLRVKSGDVLARAPKQRFAEFAKSLFERKVKTKEIRSAKGRSKWAVTLEHLIAGTEVEASNSKRFVPGLGEFFLDKLTVGHVEAWRTGIAELIAAGEYSPTTCNGWLSVLRVILKAAKRELGLPHLATDGVKDFDESEHETYTEEEPNALFPEEAPRFMEAMHELYPQHYAMVFLGLATGLRPSSLRPLRRSGPNADILWDEAKLLVRRSHTLASEVMNTTKQKVKYRIHLPDEVVKVLRWHVETQLRTPEQQESDLLFPAVTGGFRSPSVLNKPFADVASTIGLGKKFTQRGLRRTFNDLMRAAKTEAIVTRSISGHATSRMHEHYSTVAPVEQRESIGKVIDLVRIKRNAALSNAVPNSAEPTETAPRESGPGGGPQPAESGPQNEKAG